MKSIIESDKIMEERFVAFIDILGFKEIVKRIESDNTHQNPDLRRIKSVLNFIDMETSDPAYSVDLPIYVEEEGRIIERELGDPRLTYVSDCVIISAEPTLDGFKGLSRKIHKITSDLAYDGIFCRGAITKGNLFHRDKVLFGSAYIRAYELEKKAKFPRVIIDPEILSFFDLTEGKMPLAPAFYGRDTDGFYYQRYWTWYLFPPYSWNWDAYLTIVRHQIIDNLEKHRDSEDIRAKYIWLKHEFNSLLCVWKDFDFIDVFPIVDEI